MLPIKNSNFINWWKSALLISNRPIQKHETGQYITYENLNFKAFSKIVNANKFIELQTMKKCMCHSRYSRQSLKVGISKISYVVSRIFFSQNINAAVTLLNFNPLTALHIYTVNVVPSLFIVHPPFLAQLQNFSTADLRKFLLWIKNITASSKNQPFSYTCSLLSAHCSVSTNKKVLLTSSSMLLSAHFS